MASSLTPAYIRIAGPSTSHMTFENTTISIDDINEPKKLSLTKLFREDDSGHKSLQFAVTHNQWEKFVHWAKNTGFDLVFALNNDEKTSSGMWDPNTALKILTVADKANIGEIFWQLGYVDLHHCSPECSNQSIEEYLNDLETLRVIIETFPPGKAGDWQVVGGDVTHCLHEDSKSDFKDYVTLSNDMMDAILLNGNSSSQELERMSDKDRMKLLTVLSRSDTPLWLTEHTRAGAELERAADWITSLGYSARNGFSVHYRELMEKELYEPTLSFYMALLFKNLVGEKVLNVDIDSSQSIIFAHCTSLRHKPVSGAITLYGVNMDEEPARFSIKLSKKEEGGDIMQFILGHDHSGNIVVNNRAMYYEGDIRPVVKRVRPYKTLLLNLPPKSFGFWVLANTQVEACFEDSESKQESILKNKHNKAESNFIKTKRSLDVSNDFDLSEELSVDYDIIKDKALKERVDSINKDLRNIRRIFRTNSENNNNLNRVRRDAYEKNKWTKHLRRNNVKSYNNDENDGNIFSRLSGITKSHLSTIKSSIASLTQDKSKRPRNFKRNLKLKSKRNSKAIDLSKSKDAEMKMLNNNVLKTEKSDEHRDKSIRKRRSITDRQILKKYEDESSENEINEDSKESFKLGKILHKLEKISEMPLEIQDKDTDYEEDESEEGIVLKTKLSDDSATIDIVEKSHSGLLKSTLQDILSLLSDLNKNVNKFWSAITILE
ncbi:unnamed protein product, partial [Brenthis ino]